MNDPAIDKTSTGGSPSGLIRAFVWLSLALLAAFPCVAWFGYGRSGVPGVWAAAVGALVTWGSGSLALWLLGSVRNSPAAVSATLLATLVRLGAPLAVGLALERSGGELAQAGVFGMILCYYFLALIVETVAVVLLSGASGRFVAGA